MFNSLRQIIKKGLIRLSSVNCSYAIAVIVGLSFLSVSFQLAALDVFDKKDILYIDMIKNYGDNISFKFPIDVYAADNGDVYIIDSGPNKIWVFNEHLLPVSVIDKTNGLGYPISIAVNKKGMIFVSESTPGKSQKGGITVFDHTGRKKGTIQFNGFPGFENFVAKDMAIDDEGNLYLAGGSSGPLIIMTSEGKFVKSIQPVKRTQSGKEIKADVIRVDLKEDLIYLLSEWEGQIYVYNRKGDEINVFGKKGGSPGKLNRPQGMTVDPRDGIIYVMDYMRHTLLVYDQSGSFINEFGGEGWAPGWFNYPKDICIDNQGRLFVADAFNKRIQIFKTR